MNRSGKITVAAAFLVAASLSRVSVADTAPGDEILPGDRMLRSFFASEVARIARRDPFEGVDEASWPSTRETLRRELRHMLGIDALVAPEDLHDVVTGTIDRLDLGIAVEKIHFQSLPGLYVTGNLYRPRDAQGRLPAILYLCGHGRVAIDGISYGNKSHYQHHGIWFARHGYVVLIIDTLQLGEIEGLHHGTYRLDQWWWVSRGYTPAGVEAWNSMRALDLLEKRPDVDPERIGVTGRSGGGIGSWWLAALDDRIRASVPVAGITDLENHVLDGCIEGHCDCNFTINYYRWDYPTLAGLSAPRPLLFSNSDKDGIFPLDGVLRVHAELRRLYAALGASDRLGLLITEGPHQDTQELRVPAFRWMARWLVGGDVPPVTMAAEPLFDPRELKVFATLPEDEMNTRIQEAFVPRAEIPPPPASLSELDRLREEWLAELHATTFRNQPEPGAVEPRSHRTFAKPGGLHVHAIDFESDGFELPLRVLVRDPRPKRVVLHILGDPEWENGASLFASESTSAEGSGFDLGEPGDAFAVVAPRGVGPTRFNGDEKKQNQIRRRFLIIGRTLAETRIYDVRRAVRALRAVPELAESEIALAGAGEAAVLALWAAIFEPDVKALELRSVPETFERSGPALLGVLRIVDLPQALALALPRRIEIADSKANLDWLRAAARACGQPDAVIVR